MNRRDFLKFLGGAAAAAAVAPQVLAEASAPPAPAPAQSPGFIVLEPGMSVQEAINALPTEGGTVYIRSGTYIVNEAISIPQDVQLVAEGNITISSCSFKGEPRSGGEAPIVFLMEEDDDVVITDNFFDCRQISSMFEVPIGDHLAALKEKMHRLYQRAKQLVT